MLARGHERPQPQDCAGTGSHGSTRRAMTYLHPLRLWKGSHQQSCVCFPSQRGATCLWSAQREAQTHKAWWVKCALLWIASQAERTKHVGSACSSKEFGFFPSQMQGGSKCRYDQFSNCSLLCHENCSLSDGDIHRNTACWQLTGRAGNPPGL